MKTLLLDMGNTRIKWGVRVSGAWLALGHFPTQDSCALDKLLSQQAPLERVVAAHVAGPASAQALDGRCQAHGLALQWVRASAHAGGVSNGYHEPAQLGPDRWAALVAARALSAGPNLVICAGTATTIDALSLEGEFLGGLILPGLTLMTQALQHGTANLGAQNTAPQYQIFARNTADAVYSGALTATLGAIEHQQRQLEARQAPHRVRLILSGGNAPLLAPGLQSVLQVPHLVLEGMAHLVEAPDSMEKR